MKKIQKISVEECCMHYHIEIEFVQQLSDYGLIELIRSGKKSFIAHEQLSDLERYMRLHYDMDINMEGMEAISHLLHRVRNLQQEVRHLKSVLRSE